jgi:Tropomyosin
VLISYLWQLKTIVFLHRWLICTVLFQTGEGKIVNLEEELRVVGENLKALEVAEEKAQQREEEYKKQMRIITERLKIAEARYA